MPCLFGSSDSVCVPIVHEHVIFGRQLESPPSARLYVIGLATIKKLPAELTMVHRGWISSPRSFAVVENGALSPLASQIVDFWPNTDITVEPSTRELNVRSAGAGNWRASEGGRPTKATRRPEDDPRYSTFIIDFGTDCHQPHYLFAFSFDTFHGIEMRGAGSFSGTIQGPEDAILELRDDLRERDLKHELAELLSLWEFHCVGGYTVSAMTHPCIDMEVVTLGRGASIPEQKWVRSVEVSGIADEVGFIQPTSDARCFIFQPDRPTFRIPVNFFMKDNGILLPPSARTAFRHWATNRRKQGEGDDDR